MTDWQPIATAPRDGAEVDLWVISGDEQYRVANACWSVEDGAWVDGDGLFLPTHEWPVCWMPLPPPPRDTDD